MQSKSLLIAIAAFAVTATNVHAYGGSNILHRAGLSDIQVEAIQEAQELRAQGKETAARNRLSEAGITEDTLLSIHRAHQALQADMREALKNDDFEGFVAAVSDSPLADIITSKADFEQFREAHSLRQEGEWEEAADLLGELGVDTDKQHDYQRKIHKGVMTQLSDSQQAALLVARQANDRATIQAIFDEAGVEWPNVNKK